MPEAADALLIAAALALPTVELIEAAEGDPGADAGAVGRRFRERV